MAAVNLKSLIGKLNATCRETLEAAAGMCLSRTHYNVEIEHWLLKLIDLPGSDVNILLKFYGVDVARLIKDLTWSLDRLKTGNSRAPALSPQLVDMAREGWLMATLDYNSGITRSGQLLCALLNDESLQRTAAVISDELKKIPADALRKELPQLVAGGLETQQEVAAGGPRGGDAGGPAAPGAPGSKTPALDQFSIDLTAKAKRGEIDPVLGRDAEIRQVIDILTRRRQNNPILTGEAGVGKTAVVEGFAQRIAAGDVPAALRNVSVRTLDLGLLQAGAGIKGEFENRLKGVLDDAKKSPQPVILFIDEAHTLIGAGGQAGQGDAANLLKPALARGELRTIAATTWAEYKKYFEKDAALARRFQVVKVEEPSEKSAADMLRGLVQTLEAHHGVRILEEAMVDAVRLSHRYLSGRQLPDKAVSLLDTAAARVSMSHAATPPAVEDCRRSIELTSARIEILQREQAAGMEHGEEIQELLAQKAAAETRMTDLNARWQQELELVSQIRNLHDQLAGPLPTKVKKPAAEPAPTDGKPGDAKTAATAAEAKVDGPLAAAKPAEAKPATLSEADRVRLRAELAAAGEKLLALQGENPLVNVCVDGQAVAEVLEGWTGIPAGRMVRDEIDAVLHLKKKMEERIVGQSHALESIAQRIRTARAGLTDPRKPIGVFLLVGSSGVGKTETAITLAELLYGGEQNMTVINMSEFKEEHKVSLLMGSPPGYVGYGEGGVLTEAVRRRPYSVVLLDEMEKAHNGVQDIFYQVFDKGIMRDGEGRDIDFKNTVILMTSNAGTDTIVNLCADPETRPSAEGLVEALRADLLKIFKPAFLGRVTIVPYFPLADDVMRGIVELQLGRVARRVRERYKADFSYTPEVVATIVGRCHEVDSGARNIDHILTGTMLPEMAGEFLTRMSTGEGIRGVEIGVDGDGKFTYTLQ